MSRVSIDEGFDIMSRIESVCSAETHMYVFGHKGEDKEIAKFCDSNDRVDFINYHSDQSTPSGRTDKFNNLYATIDNMEWDMCVWLDSNNIYSSWYKDQLADRVSRRVDFFGSVAYLMVGLSSGQVKCFRVSDRHLIGPGKGWSREAFDKGIGAHKKKYGKYCNPFLYKQGRGYDADFKAIMNRYGFPHEIISSSPHDVLDIKAGDDLNQVERYSNSKAPVCSLNERSKDALLVLLQDYGDGFELPVKLRGKVSSLLR